MKYFNLYYVDIDYIKYLYKYDNRIQYNPMQGEDYTKKRPYLGIVLTVNGFEYFVPLEHPRTAHQKMKNNVHIYKIHEGKYGILGFNNMIPVPKTVLTKININEQSVSYKQILISQYRFCNKHSDIIYEKARKTYMQYIKGNNKFLNKICCDFKRLELKSREYGGSNVHNWGIW